MLSSAYWKHLFTSSAVIYERGRSKRTCDGGEGATVFDAIAESVGVVSVGPRREIAERDADKSR